MRVQLRHLLAVFLVLSLALGLSACGMWRGADDVSTDYGADAMGKGPGIVTGKRGGIVIYQK
jgi:hypothetical protein